MLDTVAATSSRVLRLPARLLVIGGVITVLLVLWLVWSTYSLHERMLSTIEMAASVQSTISKIHFIDEGLTLSARLAVESGDRIWEQNYRRLEEELSQAMKQVSHELGGEESLDAMVKLLASNAGLVSLEYQALGLVRENQSGEAQKIFESDDYLALKASYSRDMARFSLSLDRLLNQRIEALSTQTHRQIGAALVVLLGLFLGWAAIYRILQQQQKRLQDQSDALHKEIDERKLAEQRAWQESHLREVILDSANYTVISTDTSGVIRTFNACAERWLGYRAEEVVGKQTPAIIHDAQEVCQRAREIGEELGIELQPGFEVFVAHAKRGQADEREWRYIRKDGSSLPVLLSVTALRDQQGVITGYLGIASDITERKRMQRLKDEFISTVSHELRTPLTSIRGSLGLLEAGVVGELPEKAQEMLRISIANSERLGHLIDDLLDIEKMESGHLALDMHTLELMPLLEKAMKELQSYGREHQVSFHLGSAVSGAWVRVDEGRFAQVMGNLLSNAAKYSPAASPVVVDVKRLDHQVEISVTDKGPGIPLEFQSQVFAKFSQADSSSTRSKGGTGLGLAISKSVVEQMGGKIAFETVPSSYTRFYFRLPLVEPGK